MEETGLGALSGMAEDVSRSLRFFGQLYAHREVLNSHGVALRV